MAVQSSRKRALSRLTLAAGIVSVAAGAAIYVQVSGAAGAIEQALAAPPPDQTTTDQPSQPVQPQQPQPVQPPVQQPVQPVGPPIAVTGGS